MMTTGEETFWRNAAGVLRDIGMPHLDPAHGAAVVIVRGCLVARGRPTHHRQAFLEKECPELLAYLEKLASREDTKGWRSLEERIRFHAEVLRETNMQPCARPWWAAIWHTLPELAALGQCILDQQASAPACVSEYAITPAAAVDEDIEGNSDQGGDDKGSAGKAGSAGTTAKPNPLPRLSLPVVSVTPTEPEQKALELGDEAKADDTAKMPEGPDGGTDGPRGTNGPGGMK